MYLLLITIIKNLLEESLWGKILNFEETTWMCSLLRVCSNMSWICTKWHRMCKKNNNAFSFHTLAGKKVVTQNLFVCVMSMFAWNCPQHLLPINWMFYHGKIRTYFGHSLQSHVNLTNGVFTVQLNESRYTQFIIALKHTCWSTFICLCNTCTKERH